MLLPLQTNQRTKNKTYRFLQHLLRILSLQAFPHIEPANIGRAKLRMDGIPPKLLCTMKLSPSTVPLLIQLDDRLNLLLRDGLLDSSYRIIRRRVAMMTMVKQRSRSLLVSEGIEDGVENEDEIGDGLTDITSRRRGFPETRDSRETYEGRHPFDRQTGGSFVKDVAEGFR